MNIWYVIGYALCCTTELPGLAVAAAIVDRIGRKYSMAGLFVLCGLFLFPLVHSQPEGLTTILLFSARASIMGAFTVLYIYAPEVISFSLHTLNIVSSTYREICLVSFLSFSRVIANLIATRL